MQRSVDLELVFPDVVHPEHAKVAVRLRRLHQVSVVPELFDDASTLTVSSSSKYPPFPLRYVPVSSFPLVPELLSPMAGRARDALLLFVSVLPATSPIAPTHLPLHHPSCTSTPAHTQLTRRSSVRAHAQGTSSRCSSSAMFL